MEMIIYADDRPILKMLGGVDTVSLISHEDQISINRHCSTAKTIGNDGTTEVQLWVFDL